MKTISMTEFSRIGSGILPIVLDGGGKATFAVERYGKRLFTVCLEVQDAPQSEETPADLKLQLQQATQVASTHREALVNTTANLLNLVHGFEQAILQTQEAERLAAKEEIAALIAAKDAAKADHLELSNKYIGVLADKKSAQATVTELQSNLQSMSDKCRRLTTENEELQQRVEAADQKVADVTSELIKLREVKELVKTLITVQNDILRVAR